MKKILVLCAAVLLGGSFWIYRATRPTLFFGTAVGAPRVAPEDLLKHPKTYLGKTLSIEATIANQCPLTGCFFYVKAGDKMLRVELADVTANAPKHRDGKMAVVEGQLAPYGDTYQFVASAVEFK